MTNIERQILLNQIVIMSTLTHILRDNNGSKQDIEDLAKCGMMSAELINSQSETEIDIKQGISEQSKKWEDGCNAYNQERINKLAEEIKAKQEELRSCDEISNIVSSEYKAL